MALLSSKAARKWGWRCLYAAGILGVGYVGADYATDNSLTRSLRTLLAFGTIVCTYKFTTPTTPEELSSMHSRVARIILDTCLKNEGLYIKIGQGLNSMSHVLPREYTEVLKVLLDRAPPVPMAEIRKIIRAETGKEIEELFVRFDETPVASASIAQVHQAWLPPPADGSSAEPQRVAVKVRKPCISTQSVWDLYIYSTIMTLLKLLFDLPTDWSRKTVCDALMREMDFTLEASNAKRFRHAFRDNPRLYIPRVHDAYTSKQLLVLEWIEGTKLNDVESIRAQYDEKRVLTTLFDAVGDMVFKHGFVHADPHAANVLVRPSPKTNPAPATAGTDMAAATTTTTTTSAATRHATAARDSSDYQVVLIDFGLATPERVRFRYQYALLFVSLFTHDKESLRRVVHDWGINDAEMFASIQAQKPFEAIQAGSYDEVTRDEVIAMQTKAHERAKEILRDTRRIPKELIMVGRSLDILRGVNRLYGSPVNRMNMFVQSAVECLGPLRNYDAVDAYLKRMQKIMEARGCLTTVARDCYQEYESVYDASADTVREEQEAAAAQIAAEDAQRGLHHPSQGPVSEVYAWLDAVYRALLLHSLLFLLNAVHVITYTYNSLIAAFLPAAAQKKLRIASLEDRRDRLFGQQWSVEGEEMAEAVLAAG
ncbi:ABC transporter [Leishmania donovani]|uniref:ABC transporter, putative n=1 Tax=Leishmania donovani TaxID=5661 RepID=A0A3S5H7U4_LEIDO|nr:ABC transporter, putative [Leishmania donovani]AYU82113.1 ABC transporter, putative [Leishmania donovani]CAJ1992117.1 ABC transporter [Leishmania donovani]CBZ37280.1 ABC transporter, putative [Leishmania donovani]VDZ47954.1 ABC_transporter_putative/GeneDB:LmjF.33.1300 [Leishmania donovani]